MKRTNVFINCPFDDGYKPIFDAVTFTVYDAGFVARTALEHVGTDRDRLQKIIEIMRECPLGIHDLSGRGSGKIPRYNMPFECGLFYGAKVFGGGRQRNKAFLVLDAEAHDYKKTLSDISGKDAESHGNDPRRAIAAVRKFLNPRVPQGLPGASFFQKRYETFQDDLRRLGRQGRITVRELRSLDCWTDLVRAMTAWQEQFPY